MTKHKSKFVVIEGTDGCGKSTQLAKLCEHLEQLNINFKKLEFPRYDNLSSGAIRQYLNGEYGENPDDVNAYAASTFYAVDRYASFKQDWEQYYNNNLGIIISGRYTTSNAIHQASKLPENKQADFFNWLYDFEFGKMGLPKPDLVIYLDMPITQTVSLMRKRESDTNTKADIHEQNTEYLVACRKTGSFAADTLGWVKIPCMQNDALRSIDEIHQLIWEEVSKII